MAGVRSPAVAGTFYPADAPSLRRQLSWCIEHRLGPGEKDKAPDEAARPLALIAPHAGYRYSGPIAMHAYQRMAPYAPLDLAVIIGPNHHMLGPAVALSGLAEWLSPLGKTRIDQAANSALSAIFPAAKIDDLAHRSEHSIEVQVPFLQYCLGNTFKILPIAMTAQDSGLSAELGRALASILGDRNAIIVASTDFSHYEPQAVVTEKDRWALEAIRNLDATALLRAIAQHRITMCGPGPVVAALEAARDLGAKRGELLRYATSGDISGDNDRVVGYGALALV